MKHWPLTIPQTGASSSINLHSVLHSLVTGSMCSPDEHSHLTIPAADITETMLSGQEQENPLPTAKQRCEQGFSLEQLLLPENKRQS